MDNIFVSTKDFHLVCHRMFQVVQCSSGGPWVRIYDPDTNTGNVMGVSHGILPEPYPDESAAWSWTNDEFTQLLNFAENN